MANCAKCGAGFADNEIPAYTDQGKVCEICALELELPPESAHERTLRYARNYFYQTGEA